MEYIPKPLDTSDVVLPDGLEELTESLSKNVHEVWAAGRIAAGWKYGPVRDEIKKEHPCLIPYEELTEEEKLQYGFIFSNFMYLIRAFTHNDVFMSYVVTVIENVKATLSPQK